MNKTIIGVSFKTSDKEYEFSFMDNMTEQQWSEISKIDYELLLSRIGEQIKIYKKSNHIFEPTEPKSMKFAPHFIR